MNVFEFLRRRGPTEATYIARSLLLSVEDVYAELVLAESCGLVRPVIAFKGHKVVSRKWEAT